MKRVIIQVLLGACLSAFFLFLTLRGLDLSSVWASLSKVSLWYLLGIVALDCAAFYARALRWRVLLSKIARVPVTDVLRFILAGFFINNVLPMRAGEFYRSHLMGSHQGISRTTCLGSIVIERSFDGIVFLVLCLLAFLLNPATMVLTRTVILFVCALTVGMAGVVGMILLKGRLHSMSHRDSTHGALVKKITEKLLKFVHGLEPVASVSVCAKGLALSLVVWACDFFILYLLMGAFGFSLSARQAMFVMVGVGVAVMVPFAPGHIGTFEFAVKTTLVMLGIDQAGAVAYAIALHGFQIAFITATGFPALLSTHFRWSALMKNNSETKSSES